MPPRQIASRRRNNSSDRNLQFAGLGYILVGDYGSHQSAAVFRFVGTIVMKLSSILLSLSMGVALLAHPMGNFSVSHYTRIGVGPRGADVLYVLDLAEIPTLEILQRWKLERSSPREELERKAAEQAREWVRHLKITVGGRAVAPQFLGADHRRDQDHYGEVHDSQDGLHQHQGPTAPRAEQSVRKAYSRRPR